MHFRIIQGVTEITPTKTLHEIPETKIRKKKCRSSPSPRACTNASFRRYRLPKEWEN